MFDAGPLAVDVQVVLVEPPLPVGEGSHRLDSPPAEFRGENVHAAPGQQFLDVAAAQLWFSCF